jgi:hypothetical protein
MAFIEKLSMVGTVTLVLVMATLYITIMVPKDVDQNQKILGVVAGFSWGAAIVATFICLYFFSSNPKYQIQFLLIFVMVLFPIALTAMATATTQLSELRDTLAAGKQMTNTTSPATTA